MAVITVSDSRAAGDDESGALLRQRLEEAGFTVSFSTIVRDEPEDVRAVIARICDDDLGDAVVSTGGTGIAPRDQTYEALEPLLEKKLDGFGESFRRLSWEQIGPRAVLSRAIAGVYRGRVVIALPGSPKAISLAIDRIVGPILPHAVALARGEKHGH